MAASALSAPPAADAAWDAYPWLTVTAGYENDRLPDPDLDRYALPGGGLLGLTPGIRFGGRLGARSRLDLIGQFSYERFRNDADRAVFGGVAGADLRVPVGGAWLWRSALAGNYYSDSADETADRIGGGLETGIGPGGPGWSVELFGGVEGRRYGELAAYDDAGVLGTYTEAGLSLGLGGSARLGADALFTGRFLRQRTDARDPLYDADFWLAQGSLRAGVGLGAYLTLSALGQWRRFEARPAAEDDDSYWQVGVGLDRRMTRDLTIVARYAFARFEDPVGEGEDLQRVTVAATWGLGRAVGVAGTGDLRLPEGPTAAPLRENEPRVFRCQAPGAREVALVGDFNGWDPAAHPLRPVGDGWWQAEVRLPAGTHQYAYLVDGVAVTPADAEATVDDGLGGKNGLVQVAPGGP